MDSELITAVRLAGHLGAATELVFLHRMAHDRASSNLRREVARALGRLRDPSSLPVLAAMMDAPANRQAGLELIRWGDAALPHIVGLIGTGTTAGEDMVRTYLDHWDQLGAAPHPRVVEAVRALVQRPVSPRLRTTYHRQFLGRAEKNKPD